MAVSTLCSQFAKILRGTPSIINGVCSVSRSRPLNERILGRKAKSFLTTMQMFSFESMDKNGNALCMGESVVHQIEVNPFVKKLRSHGIKVTAIHNHWLFDTPKVMFVHFESIDKPLAFARKTRDALNVLKPGNNLTISTNVDKLCKQFANILGGTPALINGVCTATRSRLNLHPTILGRNSKSFLTIPQAYSFESMDSSGRALCLGETVILQNEIQAFISKLRSHGIKVTALHNHWLFENPRLMYVHFESIDAPLAFARKVKDALSVLK